MHATLEELRGIALLTSVSEHALESLAAVTEVTHFSANHVIAIQGDDTPPVGFVVSGGVRVFVGEAGGRQQTIARLEPGSSFNIPPAFSADHHAPASVETVSDSDLLLVSHQDFRRVVSETPDLALAILETLANRVRHLVALSHDLGLLSVRGRLASFLLRQTQKFPGEPIAYTHEEIAASIGTVREVVSRTLRTFVREGLVALDRHHLEIIDLEALEGEIDR